MLWGLQGPVQVVVELAVAGLEGGHGDHDVEVHVARLPVGAARHAHAALEVRRGARVGVERGVAGEPDLAGRDEGEALGLGGRGGGAGGERREGQEREGGGEEGAGEDGAGGHRGLAIGGRPPILARPGRPGVRSGPRR